MKIKIKDENQKGGDMITNKKNIQKQQRLTRRQFIKSTAAGAAVMYAVPSIALGADIVQKNAKSTVAIVNHKQMVNSHGLINTKNARQSVDEALLLLTKKKAMKDAWLQLFPNLKPKDTIGLKINCANPKCPTHPEIGYAIADSMIGSLDINPNNIIIWDRSISELKKAGYIINQSGKGIRCLGNIDNFDFNRLIYGTPQDESGIGYDKNQVIEVEEHITARLSKILTRMCTYLINVPVLKDHYMSGITLSLKNHYGSIDIPHFFHNNYCDPFIAKINETPQIRDKTRLVICDAAYVIYRGGPSGLPQAQCSSILASTDPVALDYTGMQIINKYLKQNNKTPVTEAMAIHVKTAQKMGLGTCNPDNIQVKKSIIS